MIHLSKSKTPKIKKKYVSINLDSANISTHDKDHVIISLDIMFKIPLEDLKKFALNNNKISFNQLSLKEFKQLLALRK